MARRAWLAYPVMHPAGAERLQPAPSAGRHTRQARIQPPGLCWRYTMRGRHSTFIIMRA